MAQPTVYRVPRRFITYPRDPHPYGLVAASFVGHVLFFAGALILSSILATRIDQSRIYIVNLVPAPPAFGTPQTSAPTAPKPSRAETARPAPAPTPAAAAPKPEEKSPPKAVRPEPPPPREAVREPAPPRLAPPPPRAVDIARAAPPRPAELALPRPAEPALPRKVEKEAPPSDLSSARTVDRSLPPPPPVSPPTPAAPPRPSVAAPAAPPALPTPPALPSPSTATARATPGRPEAPVAPKGGVSLDAGDFPFTYYLRLLHAKVADRWKRPPIAGADQSSAVVFFEIDRDGQIRGEPKIKQSSGNDTYDQAALRAVTEASPFPPLPREFPAAYLKVNFGFDFRVDQG